jgi:hypothetical protein
VYADVWNTRGQPMAWVHICSGIPSRLCDKLNACDSVRWYASSTITFWRVGEKEVDHDNICRP